MCPTKLFQFLRGALRGTYGTEDLRQRKLLIIGMGVLGQHLLGKLCLPDIDVLVQEWSLGNYSKMFGVCGQVDVYSGGDRDVIIDTNEKWILIKDKRFDFSSIGDDPYTQGIHDTYL